MAVEFWKRKVGGIPYAFVAIGAVGILAFVAWRIAPTVTPDIPEENAGDPELTEDEVYYDLDSPALTGMTGTGGFVAQPNMVYGVPVTPSTSTVDTNELWAKRAIEWLVQMGHSGGVNAQAAIGAYLDGETLSAQQAQLVDYAIKQFGTPPERPTSGTVTATPVTPARTQGTPPVNHVIKNTSENTYTKLAALYYGTSAADRLNLLVGANASKLGTTGPFAIGTVVRIPAWVAPKYVTASSPNYDNAGEIASKNSISIAALTAMNPTLKFPVKAGTRVRVG